MPHTSPTSATAVLRLGPDDNVLVAIADLRPGQTVADGPREVAIASVVPLGHKVAARDIAAGEAITKYGAPIGVACQDIAAGTHVHVHNIRSDYTPTHSLESTREGQSNR